MEASTLREQTCTLVPPLRVILWSAPRCLSSAFERSVRELKTVKVLYEPHLIAFYYGPERRTESHISSASEIDPSATWQSADKKLLQLYSGYQAVFAKNHAYFVEGMYEDYINGIFAGFKHSFLIRNPHKSVTSRMKVCRECGFEFSPTEDHGMEQLHDLFQVVQRVDPAPVVIDADDLLAYPREIMEQYCTATGLPFDEDMLQWTPGKVPDWADFKHYKVWHKGVMASSGFVKPATSEVALSASNVDRERDIELGVQQALPYYEAMYAARMQPSLGH